MVDESSANRGDHWLETLGSRHLTDWLAEQRVSLAFSTYQSAKLFFVGHRPDGRLSLFERTFSRCMGLWAQGNSIWMSSEYQIWRFENALAEGMQHEEYDRLYIPRIGYTTGDLDIHDIAIESNGRVVFANTKFSCVSTLSERASFAPVWYPSFISKAAPEDRCHLNGLALRDGKARYVSLVASTDVADGWRDRRRDGGSVIDITTGETVVTGLSMPHSPRFYRGELYVLDSGTGRFGRVDLKNGAFEPITFCPGYLRGLTFSGNYALVTLSKPREDMTFGGLAIDEELKKRNATAQCGVQVIDLKTGNVEHWLRLEGQVTELYDVVVLPGCLRPMALGFKTDEIKRILSIGESPGV